MVQRTFMTSVLLTALVAGWFPPARATDDLVIPGDHSKYLLDKIPLNVDTDIDWNKAKNVEKLRSEIVSILTDVDLFIQPPPKSDLGSEPATEPKIETNPDGQTGDVP